jgi:hypothetical protein
MDVVGAPYLRWGGGGGNIFGLVGGGCIVFVVKLKTSRCWCYGFGEDGGGGLFWTRIWCWNNLRAGDITGGGWC